MKLILQPSIWMAFSYADKKRQNSLEFCRFFIDWEGLF